MLFKSKAFQSWLYRLPQRIPFGLPFTVAAGKLYTWCNSTTYTGLSLEDDQSPAVAIGDAFIYDAVTLPGGYAVTVAGDGTVSIASAGDASRQTFVADIWDRSLNALYGSFTVYVNDSVPVLGTVATQAWAVGVTLTYDLPITDADDALSALVLTGTLPTGVTTAIHTYNPGPSQFLRQRLEYDGTGSGAASGNITDLRVTDVAGEFATFASFAWSRVDGIQVPTTAAGTIPYATYLATAGGLGFAVQTPFFALNGAITAGNVIETSPAYPSYAPPGALLLITVSGVAVPDLSGLTTTAATAVLVSAGLLFSGVTSLVLSGVTAGRVSSTNPESASLVLPGTQISYLISATAVPNVVGLASAVAVATLVAAGLTAVSPGLGNIGSQSPLAGVLVLPGAVVVLILGPLTGTDIVNANAISIASNDEICDRTGFKVIAGTLKREWTGAMVRPESWESRHPQDFVRSRPEKPRGSPRPEQDDSFIDDDDQVHRDDL